MLAGSKIIDRIEDCGNGYGWSILEWDDDFYGVCFELAVLRDGVMCYDSGITSDVVRGDWSRMEELKEEIRGLQNV